MGRSNSSSKGIKYSHVQNEEQAERIMMTMNCEDRLIKSKWFSCSIMIGIVVLLMIVIKLVSYDANIFSGRISTQYSFVDTEINDDNDENENKDDIEEADDRWSNSVEVGTEDFNDVLPRTYKKEYNNVQAGKKYFMYYPNGGFSNQLQCMENAILIGKLLNRTVLIPMAGRHSTGWHNYKLMNSEKDLFPFDRILDFDFLQAYGVEVVPLSISVDEMAKKIHSLKDDGVSMGVVAPMSQKEANELGRIDALQFGRIHNTKTVLFFQGTGMYHPWFPSSSMVKIRKHLRFSEYIRKFAVERVIKKYLNGPGNYNSVHIRRGDYFGGWEGVQTPPVEDYIESLHERGANRTTPLYIATEPTADRTWFHPLMQRYKKSFFSTSATLRNVTQEFRKMFPIRARGDFEGLLDISICVCSDIFVPSDYSTFSHRIHFYRRQRDYMFPECELGGEEVDIQSSSSSSKSSSSKFEKEEEDDEIDD